MDDIVIHQMIEFGSCHIGLFSTTLGTALTVLSVEWYFRKTRSQSLSLNQAVLLINREKPMILDTREATSFLSGHLLNALQISDSKLPTKLKKLKPDTPILLITTQGKIAYKTRKMLKLQGFSKIFYLEGGIQAWQQAGLPLSTSISHG
jgi:rhodanese-related sulfurtransferase